MRLARRLGDDREALLEVPRDHHLRRRAAEPVRDLRNRRIVQQPFALADRAPALRHDAVRLVVGDLVGSLVMRVQLDLVDRGRHAGRGDDAVEMLGQEIGDADRARLARLAKLHQRLPRRHVPVLRGRRPVDEVQVDRVHSQQRQALVQRRRRVALPLVPQLGRDERVGRLDAFADAALVAVDGGGVDQPETGVEPAADDRGRLRVGGRQHRGRPHLHVGGRPRAGHDPAHARVR